MGKPPTRIWDRDDEILAACAQGHDLDRGLLQQYCASPPCVHDWAMKPADTLWTPSREHVITTNAWAFLHWLRATRAMEIADWAGLHRFSATDPVGFRAAFAAFARIPETPGRVARHAGRQEALVLLRPDGARLAFSRDDLQPAPVSLPTDIFTALTRLWSRASLTRALADLLLHQDLRPDDRVLLAGSPSWPTLAALMEGTTVIIHAGRPDTMLALAAEERASVLVAPAGWLADGSFQRSGRRADLRALRSIVITGGPLAPEARTRVSMWVKPNIMMVARAGETIWGNPLEPVRTRPAPAPALFAPVRGLVE